MKQKVLFYDIVVAGGGLAGICAALSAARLGKKTVLVQERPVLGGNSSSEIRVTPHGAAAFHHYGRETGIISELLEEERRRNHQEIFENGWTNSVWDMVLYDACVSEINLDFFLNTSVFEVVMNDTRTIKAVKARILGAETELELNAGIFIDATGDAYVADAAGCTSMRGSESQSVYGEIHAPVEGRRDDEMGSSLHFRIRDVGKPVDFIPPDWAVTHDDPSYFWDSGRKLKDLRGGFWWIEIAKPWDTIEDAETIRHELTRHLLGIWDWMKNKDPVTRDECRNLALDWIGQVPGKRESRRIVGEYLMSENDIQEKTDFDDEVAFGGWFLDLHTPGGLLARHSEERSKEAYSPYGQKAADSYVGPYAIPYRVMCPVDVDNLMIAGRSLSLTHAAFGSVRVMGTLALLGQAAGTAAVRSLDSGRLPSQADPTDINAIQQRLLRDGAFLNGHSGNDSGDLAKSARISASSRAMLSAACPEDTWADGGMGYWKDQIDPRITDRLDTLHAQIIPVSAAVDAVSIYLSNDSDVLQYQDLVLRTTDHIWNYQVDAGELLSSVTLEVLPGSQWYTWNVNIPDGGCRLLRLEAGSSKYIHWPIAGVFLPGCVSYFGITEDRLRTFGQGTTLCFSIEPPQDVYPPENIISGWTRPYRDTGAWRSGQLDMKNEAWIRLDWDIPAEIAEVQITFPGQLLREYHAYPPGFKDPQIARDYILEYLQEGSESESWVEIVRVGGNYHRVRRHEFEMVTQLLSLRLRITGTNGDASASVYEIRCYPRGNEIWSI